MNLDFSKHIILENEFVLLRPIIEDDYSNLIEPAFADRDLLQFSPNQVYSPDLLKTFIHNALLGFEKETKYTFIIFDKTRQKYAGSSSFLNISNYDSRLEIGGTWYSKEFHRTGLNRNCKFILLSYAFDELEFQRVEFRIDERNIASIRGCCKNWS